jgi:hypothetical protein
MKATFAVEFELRAGCGGNQPWIQELTRVADAIVFIPTPDCPATAQSTTTRLKTWLLGTDLRRTGY